MKKWITFVIVLLLVSEVFAQKAPDSIGERLAQKLEQLQTGKRLQEQNIPGAAIKLSTQGEVFVKRILKQLESVKAEVKGLEYPPAATDKNQSDRVDAIGMIADTFTGIMDEYNAVRKTDVLAARVAGAQIGEAVLVSKDGKRFTIPEFLQEHQSEMLDAVMVEELVVELEVFAKHINQDVLSMHK